MINQYFKTGKTIVIDDQYEEAKPLLDALSKNHIPYIYTQGKPNSDFPLPNSNVESAQYYNLVFLDLNLDFKFSAGGLNENDEKTFKATHANLFDTLIKNVNRSFIVVLWSNEEENYRDAFLKIFTDSEKYKTTKKPYKIISLTKTDYFSKSGENYVFQPGKAQELKEKITHELSDLEAFKLFCKWEVIASCSVGNCIDDFMGLINDIQKDDELEPHLAKALTCLAIAYSGEERYLKITDTENINKTKSVLYLLSQILVDDLDKNIFSGDTTIFEKWTAVTNKTEIETLKSQVKCSILNRKLLQFKTSPDYLINAVYFTGNSAAHNDIFDSYFESSSRKTLNIALDTYKKANQGNPPSNIETFKLNLRNFIFNYVSEIEVDVTPACDIANDKAPIHRLLLGLAIPHFLIKSFNLSGPICKTPAFEVEKTKINSNPEEYVLLLDFRYLITKPKKNLLQKNYLFSLRTNLVNDIQTKLASHVSRLGTLNL